MVKQCAERMAVFCFVCLAGIAAGVGFLMIMCWWMGR